MGVSAPGRRRAGASFRVLTFSLDRVRLGGLHESIRGPHDDGVRQTLRGTTVGSHGHRGSDRGGDDRRGRRSGGDLRRVVRRAIACDSRRARGALQRADPGVDAAAAASSAAAAPNLPARAVDLRADFSRRDAVPPPPGNSRRDPRRGGPPALLAACAADRDRRAGLAVAHGRAGADDLDRGRTPDCAPDHRADASSPAKPHSTTSCRSTARRRYLG